MRDDLTPGDLTLEEMRPLLGAAIAPHVAFDGWTAAARDAGATAIGIDAGVARLALPGGAVDMIDAWFASVDTAMLARLPAETLAAMKIRARITALVEARIDAVATEIEALRRALAVLALPQNLARAARLDWRAADAMWRAAGDRTTDLNHYSKRAILGGVYAATLLVLVGDGSEGQSETRAFLARRIEGIMRFERIKSRITAPSSGGLSVSRFLGRLRYPAR